MWFCCDTHQIDYNAKEIRAKPNALLMGKLFIILHASNIRQNAIKFTLRTVDDEYSVHALLQTEQSRIDKKQQQKQHAHKHNAHGCQHEQAADIDGKQEEKLANTDEHTSWDGVQAFNCYCSRCETLLGISYKSVNPQSEHQNEVLNECHLWKFELCVEGKYDIPYSRKLDEMDNVYHWYCVENYFATKIAETAKQRTIHKFLIHDDHESVFIKINLLSSKCFIKCALLSQSSECRQMAPALKILFVESSLQSFEENEQWSKQQKAHCITSSTENCRILLEYLQRYNEIYPAMIGGQSFAENMKMSFLRILSKTWRSLP